MPPQIKKIWEILPFLIFVILVAVFFGKTLFPPSGSVLYGGDLNDQFYYWKSFWAENIKSGTIPFWNPYSFSGTPFLAHPSTAAFYPLNIIYLIFPINLAFSLYLYTHLVLAGLFMYFLVSSALASRPGLEREDGLAALASGVIFALSGLIAARIYSGHIDIISTYIWIPAVFLQVTEAIKGNKRKNISLSILFFTLQILAGYQAIVIFTLELIFIYQAVMAGFDHKNIVRRFINFVLIIIISFGLSAIQILPTLEFVKNSIRGNGLPYTNLTWGSYTTGQFLTLIKPFLYGNPFPESYSYTGPGPNFFELSYFAGIIPILLLLIYILRQGLRFVNKKEIDRKFIAFFTALIFFVFAAMGNNTPLHYFLYQLFPPYRLFRFPSQHLMMAVFIIALIAGLAISQVKNKVLRLVILLLIITELLSYDSKFIRLAKIPTDSFDHNLTSILTKDTEIVRVLPDYSVVSPVRKAWDFESASLYKIQTTSGYNPILLNSYYKFIDLVNKNAGSSISQYNVEIPPPDPSSKDIDFLNVKYLLADKNYDNVKDKSLDKYTLIKEGETYRLYENKNYLPRFFISCPGNNIQKADIIDYRLNSIRLKINAVCDGTLSSSEVYYPGWQAKVDGKSVPVYQSKTAFRTISLPKGNHLVEFYYQPTVYYLGGLITLISLCIGTLIINKYY